MMNISDFMQKYFRHLNSKQLIDAAKSYKHLLNNNGKICLTLSGPISIAEIGNILSEMIMKEKIHCIYCTGKCLEQDIINIINRKKLEYISIVSNRSYEELDMEYIVIALLIPKYLTVDDVIKNCGIKSKYNIDRIDDDSDIIWRRCKLGNGYKKEIEDYINSVL